MDDARAVKIPADHGGELEHMIVAVIGAALGQPGSALDPELPLDSLGIDSHALSEIVLELEDRLDFEFSEEELDRFAESPTVREIVAAIDGARRLRATA